ncbi:hypothetical protein FI667_g5740, partial [Globisporangium splendens]
MHRNETMENKTEKIKETEEERDWYRKEALRLDAFTTSMTKDLKYMKEKLEAIEEDRNWLEKQLKACKKQNKLLRAELDVRISSPANTGVENSMLPAFESQNKGSAAMSRKQTKRNSESSVPGGSPGGLPYLNQEASTLSPTMLEEREEKMKRQLKALKRELQQKNRELVMMKQQRYLGKDEQERSHLENFFIQCVESIKGEVIKRRNGISTGFDRKQDKSGLQGSTAGRIRNQKYDVGPDFEDFTAADRVRLIERLLSHDEVLTFLYEHLFPTQLPSEVVPRPLDNKEKELVRNFTTYPSSESAGSLPETSQWSKEPLDRNASFEGGNTEKFGGKPAGSGAAAVRSGGLPLDDYTKDYLRSM